jgi:hypothetical protein
MTSNNEDDSEKLAKLEKCLDDLKKLYEYENQETFVLNFNLYNDNVKLNDLLKQMKVENESLLNKCNTLMHENKQTITKFDALTLENLTLKRELNKIRNEINEHRRSESVPKRLNKTLNGSFCKKKNVNNKYQNFLELNL